MEKLSIYPLGFAIPTVSGMKENNPVNSPSPWAERIWTLYQQRNVNMNSSSQIHQEVIEFMLTVMSSNKLGYLFGNLISHSTITPSAYRYLVDTIDYILDGRRSISFPSVPYMLKIAEENEERSKCVIEYDVNLLFNDEGLNLANWLKAPNGLVDMIWFIKIVFGDVLAKE